MGKQRNSQRVYYEKNKKEINERKRKSRKEMAIWFRKIKANHKCVLCREGDASCIEFHHINKDDKNFTISDSIRNGYSKQRILEELAKCIPICSNCHKKIHKNERISKC